MLVLLSGRGAHCNSLLQEPLVQLLKFCVGPFQRHERQAQQQYQLQLRKKREEEELRLAEKQARQEWDQERAGTPESPVGEDANQERGLGVGKPGGDKPKRPSSLLTSNNVLKLKQMIPLQGKFTTSSSPTGSEPKLPGFLNFKFLKSPEMKKDPTAALSAAAAAASSSQEKSQSPSKSFNPGKLFHFAKSDGSDQHSKAADSIKTNSGQQPHHHNTTPEQLSSQEDDGEDSTDSDASPSKKL